MSGAKKVPSTGLSEGTPSKTEKERQDVGENPEDGPQEDETVSPTKSEDLTATGVKRETWGSKVSYILTLVGYAVGFGNIWRFPYLVQENGGAVFLIPYTISVFLLGVPIFYLELAIGQRLRKGPVGTWHEVSPYLGGMGITTGLVCLLVGLYYNTLVAWVISYILDSFRGTLLYSDCYHAVDNATYKTDDTFENEWKICEKAGASQYYWHERVLKISKGIENSGDFNWWILIVLIIAWALVYLILAFGLKVAGKVVYFTALFPYVVLLIFFIRGLCLDDMKEGYRVLFEAKWERLEDPQVWKNAASQIFFSLGIGYGCLIAFASYLKPNNDCYTDAIVVAIVNCATSIFATLTIFPYLGYYGMKNYRNCVNEKGEDACSKAAFVQSSAGGTGLVFIVFAQAMATLPGSQAWAFLFFTMLLTLGIDSAFGTIEGLLAAIVDLQLGIKRWMITTAVCVVCCLFALMFSWGWGIYLLTFMDDFTANWPLVLVGLAECIGIGWVYGLQRFARDLSLMTGNRPSLYWLICWKYVSPLLILGIMTSSFVSIIINGLNYDRWDHRVGQLVPTKYPAYAIGIGFTITLLIIIWIPLIAILRYFKVKVIKDEASAEFPEDELIKERNYKEGEEIGHDSVTKLVLWPNPHRSNTELPTVEEEVKKTA